MDERIVQSAKDEAYKEATTPNIKKLEALVEKALSDRSSKATEPVKAPLRQARKERMRTGQFFLCDSCDVAIHNPTEGYVVHGNIYVADPTTRGGLIGNNFPNVSPGDKIEVTDVQETVFCKKCFCEAILLEPRKNPDIDKAKAAEVKRLLEKKMRDMDTRTDTTPVLGDMNLETALVGPRPARPGRNRRSRRNWSTTEPMAGQPTDAFTRALDRAIDNYDTNPRVSMESRSLTNDDPWQ